MIFASQGIGRLSFLVPRGGGPPALTCLAKGTSGTKRGEDSMVEPGISDICGLFGLIGLVKAASSYSSWDLLSSLIPCHLRPWNSSPESLYKISLSLVSRLSEVRTNMMKCWLKMASTWPYPWLYLHVHPVNQICGHAYNPLIIYKRRFWRDNMGQSSPHFPSQPYLIPGVGKTMVDDVDWTTSTDSPISFDPSASPSPSEKKKKHHQVNLATPPYTSKRNQHNNYGKSSCSMGKIHYKSPFSIANCNKLPEGTSKRNIFILWMGHPNVSWLTSLDGLEGRCRNEYLFA